MTLRSLSRSEAPLALACLNALASLALAALLCVVPGCGEDAGLTGGEPDAAKAPDLFEPEPFCGDGVVNAKEECDNGSNKPGSGCEPECKFTCTHGVDDAKCDDGDPCTGTEQCGSDHKCHGGTPADDGASCGMNKICKRAVCVDATCGDGITTSPEECDDANIANGDGCDACRFSCVANDPMRGCKSADLCIAPGTCDAMTHVCAMGTPRPDGAPCGPGMACMKGVCAASLCGNNKVDMGEQCDDGNQVPGDGCEPSCVFTCGNPAIDCKQAPPACGKWSCNAKHLCESVADLAQDGKACGMNLICKTGACVNPMAVCGNGLKEMGEDCDFGMGMNTPGSGCEPNCKFSCVKMPDSCPDMNACNGVESCVNVTVNGQPGQKCMAGMNLADGVACGQGMVNICLMGACKASLCGDGFIDKGKGEQCEPPGTMVCDKLCHTPSVCGDGVRSGIEQCDDSNKVNLDGCDAMCNFEQIQRINYFKMQFAADATCTKNALGGAIGQLAQGQLQTPIDTGIQDGSITLLFAFLGLTDLTGTTQPNFKVGVLPGTPAAAPMGVTYNGTNDVDWWYTADPMAIDMARVPLSSLPAALAMKNLTAGPGNLTVMLALGGAPAPLRMSGVQVTVSVGAVSTPKNNAVATPGHVAAEHLDPALMSFATTGQQNANGAGKLCGNITAASLSKVTLPAAVLMNCNQYTMNNSMLDLIVGGCSALGGLITVIRATQPDVDDPGVNPVGAGPPYRLTSGGNKIITGCTDRSGAAVNLQNCLDDAAYSTYFKFTTDRVIINK